MTRVSEAHQTHQEHWRRSSNIQINEIIPSQPEWQHQSRCQHRCRNIADSRWNRVTQGFFRPYWFYSDRHAVMIIMCCSHMDCTEVASALQVVRHRDDKSKRSASNTSRAVASEQQHPKQWNHSIAARMATSITMPEQMQEYSEQQMNQHELKASYVHIDSTVIDMLSWSSCVAAIWTVRR